MLTIKISALVAGFALGFVLMNSYLHKGDEPSAEPDRPRDEAVMEVVLLHFLKDKGEGYYRLDWEGRDFVLLHPRNPEKIGYISKTQVEWDLRPRKLPVGLLDALIRRNDAKQDYLTKRFDYAGFRFDPRIKVVDISKLPSPFERGAALTGALKDIVKRAKGYFECFAPAYSADGKQAVVRAMIGPTTHGATATYLLKLKDGSWNVVWRKFALYA